MTWMKRLGQYIGQLFGIRQMKCVNIPTFDLITNSVTINFDVLGPLMKDRIRSKIESRLVITINIGRGSHNDLEVG